MENQMENQMDNEMEATKFMGLYSGYAEVLPH